MERYDKKFDSTGTFTRNQVLKFIDEMPAYGRCELAYHGEVQVADEDDRIYQFIKQSSRLRDYFKKHGFPPFLALKDYQVKSKIFSSEVCVQALAVHKKDKYMVMIKMPMTGLIVNNMLHEYMLQHHAHEVLKEERCSAPKPLGILRYKTRAGSNTCTYFIVSQYTPIIPGSPVVATLNKVLQTHVTNSLLSLIEYRNLFLYLIEALELLQKNDIYHNALSLQNVVLRFLDNTIHPVIVNFGNASRCRYRTDDPPATYYPSTETSIAYNPQTAPELYQQPNPLPTTDLYGLSYMIRSFSEIFYKTNTLKLIDEYRAKSPQERDGHSKLQAGLRRAMNIDLGLKVEEEADGGAIAIVEADGGAIAIVDADDDDTDDDDENPVVVDDDNDGDLGEFDDMPELETSEAAEERDELRRMAKETKGDSWRSRRG